MSRRPIRRFAFAVLVLVLSAGMARAESLLVFAAASMTDAVSEAARVFEQETGTEVTLSFAASSALAKQIEHGAPAGVYISANPDWMDYLEERGLIAAASRRDIAANRLALIVPAPGQRAESSAASSARWAPATESGSASPGAGSSPREASRSRAGGRCAACTSSKTEVRGDR